MFQLLTASCNLWMQPRLGSQLDEQNVFEALPTQCQLERQKSSTQLFSWPPVANGIFNANTAKRNKAHFELFIFGV